MTAEDKTAVKSPSGGPAPPLSELKRLGKYLIEKKIGAGGMGAVFLGRDTELKRTVALKVLPRDKAENPILVRRFRAEAQAAAQLRHPNIVAVFDSGEADGFLYIAMEYVEGHDLFEMVSRRGVVPVRRSINIIKQVAAALQHAFEQNIVHRDIKPSNLLLRNDGVVKLTDLGLARSIDDTLETNITRAGTTVGTVDYMAPEQARNSKLADIRSDLYSLGCTWYQMLTGSPPYPEGSVTNKLQAHAIKPIPDPREKNPQIPEGLTAVISRLMAKKPEDRYQTPAELIEELNHAKLTQASISREIFSDLSDDGEDGPELALTDDELSDDGYFGQNDIIPDQETPDEVIVEERPLTRKKSPRQTTDATAEETEPAARRSKPRPDLTEEPEESPPASYKSRPRPVKSDPHEDDSSNSPARTTRSRHHEPEPDAEPEPEAIVRKPKIKSGKPDANEPTGQTSSRADEGKPGKPRNPGQKALPPKRQPVEEQEEKTPLLSQEFVRFIAAAGGVVVVIVGLGLLISRFGNNVDIDKTELGPDGENNPASINNPVKPPSAQTAENPNPAENTTVASAANSTTGGTGRTDVFDVDRIPDWAAKDADITGLQNLTVGPAARSATHFSTLADALQAVPAGGAVITLQGTGPFPLPLVELTQRKRIVVTSGTAQERPTILLKPAEGKSTAGLKMSDGTLELRGLHFSIDRQVMSGPFKAVEVVDGQLLVRQCSFTATGAATDPAVALAVQSMNDSTSVPRIEPNLLIDRVLVRGTGLGGVSIHRANVDAVIRDTMMLTGGAPAIEVTGHIAATVADVATARPRRIVRIHRCTLSSQNRIFDLSVDDAGKPPQTALVVKDSICAAMGVVPGSAVAYAGKWPQVRSTESWLTRLSWSSTNSLYLGFEQLIDLGSSFKVTDASTWQRVWNVRTDPRQFQKLAFPETAFDDLSVTLPQEFDANGLSYREVKAADGSLPGCPIGKLSVPDVTSQQRAVALASRPSLPAAAVKPTDPAQVRKIDLKKEDLGTVLSRGDWPNGTLFEASGSGICLMTPVNLEGKSLRIVFRQIDGVGLRVQPKPAEAGKPNPPALICVTGGTLDLTNVVLEGIGNSKAATPEWLLQATDATLILNGCRLLGPEIDNPRQLGLIRWITAPGPTTAEAPALVVRESYLAGTGSGIRAECGQGSLILRNSVISIRGDALDLRPVRTGNALSPVLDAENLTVSASSAAIRFAAAPGTEPVTGAMRLFMDRCVFAPPLTFKSGESAGATLLQLIGPVIEQRQVEWWGASNGVARQVLYLVKQDGDSGPSDERTGLSAWRKLWEKAASIRLLTGDKGIYLAGELPVRWKELKPASFELHKSSQGATWAEGGRPIGANTSAVEASSLPKKGGETTRPGVVPNPGNKKNVGF